ncbi:MAG: DUF362 domain-containing protein [Anaerolineae bacterium]|jgi:uncharacterized protein (DUF362 family)|nr:DUF362 domain-containing protein [Chloroflexota bacterium]
MSQVALVRGTDRSANVTAALAAVADNLDLSSKERIVVKPNFVSTNRPLSATHVDATRAVIAFLLEHGARHITLAEGPASGTFAAGLDAYGYRPLIERFGLSLVDLNQDETLPVEGFDSQLRPRTLRVSRTVLESDMRVSVGPPKTHDGVIVTLSLKNYAVGSVVGKRMIHEGNQALNLNIYRLARATHPHLAVIDGFVGMEGDGPTRGTAVDWGIALASTDALALDCLTARLMGFDPHGVGYLHYALLGGLGQGEPEEIEILGSVTPEEVTRPYKPHSTIASQRIWQVENVSRYL